MVSYRGGAWRGLALAAVVWVGTATAHADLLAESKRMDRAKDFMAEEQWLPAIAELTAAANDPKEPGRDEALFWLAHSQNQVRQSMAALETIDRLEQGFAASRWMKPAQSLRLEIAQRLGRFDVLWRTARPAGVEPPPPLPPPVAGAPAPPMPPRRERTPPRAEAPRPPRTRVLPGEPAMVAVPPPARGPGTPRPPTIWVTEMYASDTDLRIQALGSLIRTDADKVIPILKEIALESDNPGQARRALFVLAQSGRPDARSTVVEVARTATESVRVAAVRELGRIRGTNVSNDLMQVYSSGNAPVKVQVVSALGERSATVALMRIAEEEADRQVRDAAITTLGAAGGREQLRVLYARSSPDNKRPILAGLFNAKADVELIQIARTERDASIRNDVLAKLRLLGTPRAEAYLQTVQSR